jgi:hypothetical protein
MVWPATGERKWATRAIIQDFASFDAARRVLSAQFHDLDVVGH